MSFEVIKRGVLTPSNGAVFVSHGLLSLGLSAAATRLMGVRRDGPPQYVVLLFDAERNQAALQFTDKLDNAYRVFFRWRTWHRQCSHKRIRILSKAWRPRHALPGHMERSGEAPRMGSRSGG